MFVPVCPRWVCTYQHACISGFVTQFVHLVISVCLSSRVAEEQVCPVCHWFRDDSSFPFASVLGKGLWPSMLSQEAVLLLQLKILCCILNELLI